MKISDEMDRELVTRYSLVLLSHPGSALISCTQWNEENCQKFANGELTHMLYRVGNLVYSRWVPTVAVQHFFDSYAE